jgi:hypothetical protein
MIPLDEVIRKMKGSVEARCAERIEEAAHKCKESVNINKMTEEYGISSGMKKRRGL